VDILDPDIIDIDSGALVRQDPGIVFVLMLFTFPNPVPVIRLILKEGKIRTLAMGIIAEIG